MSASNFISCEPEVDFKSHSLSSGIADDNLIASALDYHLRHNLDQPVFIATDDLGLKIKIAAKKGIEILELPSKYRLKVEPDKIEAENAKLRQQLALLESRIPELSVAFRGGKSWHNLFFTKPASVRVLSPLQIREKYPLKAADVQDEKLPKPRGTAEQFKAHYSSPTHQNKKIEEYYERYEKYYADCVAYEEEISLCFWLQLVISVKGTAPASGIDLYLYFPEGVKAVDGLSEKPKCPSPPGERPHNLMSIGHFHNHAHLASAHLANSNNGKPRIEGDGHHVVHEATPILYRLCACKNDSL